jgi:hypothetical protein
MTGGNLGKINKVMQDRFLKSYTNKDRSAAPTYHYPWKKYYRLTWKG